MDAQILAALAGDDPAAFSALVRLHQGGLRAFLRRLTRGDQALADDLAQESFLEAWRKIGQFRGDAPFAAWLHRIAWSRFLMTARKRKPEPLDAADELTRLTGVSTLPTWGAVSGGRVTGRFWLKGFGVWSTR